MNSKASSWTEYLLVSVLNDKRHKGSCLAEEGGRMNEEGGRMDAEGRESREEEGG